MINLDHVLSKYSASNDICWLQGLVGLTSNPVLANGIAGLATSATAFAAVERVLLYQMRNATVEPFGETVQQVFARISALRDSLDGPQVSPHSYTLYALPCCFASALTSFLPFAGESACCRMCVSWQGGLLVRMVSLSV